MTSGQVYVLTNEGMPGFVKVGKTTSDAEYRARNLSSATGIPLPFKVFKAYAVTDCDLAEKFAHKILEATVGRPNNQREFFNGPPETICTILNDALTQYADSGARTGTDGFEEALRRVSRKEFTFACAEFEPLLRQASQSSPIEFYINQELRRMLGVYLACCISIDREPILRNCICDPRIKAEAMTVAIDTMKAWRSEPTIHVVSFVRALCA